ncbi:MAG: DUF1571 domain-containing protein [Sedimentisphaerales bacterium]|nr:DUF1571 domain-containing protein [Sedimentisphaerales bacterium]
MTTTNSSYPYQNLTRHAVAFIGIVVLLSISNTNAYAQTLDDPNHYTLEGLGVTADQCFYAADCPNDPNRLAINEARIIYFAQHDHIALLEWALQKHTDNINDYTATFYKQERIQGRLKPVEVISIRFRENPFSLLMVWRENAGPADKLLYVAGQNDGNMLVHPTGFFSWISSVSRDPHHPDVTRNSLRTCDQFGFRNTINNMLDVYRQASRNGDLQITYVGPTTIDDRPCQVFERNLPNNGNYPYAKMVVAIDIEYVLPTSITCYDWQGRIVSQYIYKDLRFNTGLTSSDFTPRANGM